MGELSSVGKALQAPVELGVNNLGMLVAGSVGIK